MIIIIIVVVVISTIYSACAYYKLCISAFHCHNTMLYLLCVLCVRLS